MPRNDERLRRDLEILGLELSASEGMNAASVVMKFFDCKPEDVSNVVEGKVVTRGFYLAFYCTQPNASC